ALPAMENAAFSSVELVRRNVTVMVSPVTPWDVLPPLLPLYAGTQIGAYTLHGTWRTPGPQFTPLRVIPAEPAAAGGVMPLGTASARWPPAAPPAELPPFGPAAVPPAAVLSVVPSVPPVPKPWPVPLVTLVDFEGATLGTRMTTRSKTRRPINSGEYRRATCAT